MLFIVDMKVNLPPDMAPERAVKLKADEREMAQRLQREGRWRHLWRVAGSYANVSVFDVESPEQLQEAISSLPLFPYMDINVRAVCRHPSSIHEDDR
ncbi:muconolactone Delta-isomerase [Halotalea alkalilenta]|uniref:muconolactone Delta-isomerase n=1 Tax=Halotalea alkalilenta TaxID=376489 RepID=UPI0004853C4C|nr:muconolactone Delta-isomerase [Halotalea alkalilenta]